MPFITSITNNFSTIRFSNRNNQNNQNPSGLYFNLEACSPAPFDTNVDEDTITEVRIEFVYTGEGDVTIDQNAIDVRSDVEDPNTSVRNGNVEIDGTDLVIPIIGLVDATEYTVLLGAGALTDGDLETEEDSYTFDTNDVQQQDSASVSATYELTSNYNEVLEGQSYTVTLTTTGLEDGTVVPYSLGIPFQSSEFSTVPEYTELSSGGRVGEFTISVDTEGVGTDSVTVNISSIAISGQDIDYCDDNSIELENGQAQVIVPVCVSSNKYLTQSISTILSGESSSIFQMDETYVSFQNDSQNSDEVGLVLTFLSDETIQPVSGVNVLGFAEEDGDSYPVGEFELWGHSQKEMSYDFSAINFDPDYTTSEGWEYIGTFESTNVLYGSNNSEILFSQDSVEEYLNYGSYLFKFKEYGEIRVSSINLLNPKYRLSIIQQELVSYKIYKIVQTASYSYYPRMAIKEIELLDENGNDALDSQNFSKIRTRTSGTRQYIYSDQTPTERVSYYIPYASRMMDNYLNVEWHNAYTMIPESPDNMNEWVMIYFHNPQEVSELRFYDNGDRKNWKLFGKDDVDSGDWVELLSVENDQQYHSVPTQTPTGTWISFPITTPKRQNYSIRENQDFQIKLNTENVLDNVQIPYSISTDLTLNDFDPPLQSFSGSLTILNNEATLDLKVANQSLTYNDVDILVSLPNHEQSKNILVENNPFNNTNVYNLTSDSSSILEGDSVTITLSSDYLSDQQNIPFYLTTTLTEDQFTVTSGTGESVLQTNSYSSYMIKQYKSHSVSGNILDNNKLMKIVEVELIDDSDQNVMTTGNYLVSTSASSTNSDNPLEYAYDTNTDNSWINGYTSGQWNDKWAYPWYRMDFNDSIILKKIRFYGIDTLKDWELLGSNDDGNTWTTILSFQDYPTVSNQWVEEDINQGTGSFIMDVDSQGSGTSSITITVNNNLGLTECKDIVLNLENGLGSITVQVCNL